VTKKSRVRIFWVAVFGITMGYFEASVVVYLRALLCPGGFSFPLAVGPMKITLVEIGREAMSVGMLIAVGALAGRNFFEGFCLFCLAFGVWDIFYYIFLKLILNWPASLFTWDILFLIPVPWVGPVWAPVLCAIAFIVTGILVVHQEDIGRPVRPRTGEWIMAVSGGLLVIASFCEECRDIIKGGVPHSFAWPVFFAGFALGLFAFTRAWNRAKKTPDPDLQ